MLAAPDFSVVYVLVLFALAYLILSRLFVSPIVQMLESREIEAREAAEKRALAARDAAEKSGEVEKELRRMREEAIAIRQSLRAEGDAARQEELGRARRRAGELIATGRAQLAAELPRLKADLENEARSLADEVMARLVGA